MTDRTSDRRVFVASAGALTLSACSNVVGPGPALQIYLVQPRLPPASPGPKVPWALAVMRPDANDSLDTVRIPVVKADGTMDFYAGAQFPDRITALVQQALVAGFEASGRIDQVSAAQDGLHADYDLIADIRDFEVRYSTPEAPPTALIRLSVKLAAARGRRIVASFAAAQRAPAAADNIAAATDALRTALAQAVEAVVGWSLGQPLAAPAGTSAIPPH
jgi:cholesterol transport system auxiliary component